MVGAAGANGCFCCCGDGGSSALLSGSTSTSLRSSGLTSLSISLMKSHPRLPYMMMSGLFGFRRSSLRLFSAPYSFISLSIFCNSSYAGKLAASAFFYSCSLFYSRSWSSLLSTAKPSLLKALQRSYVSCSFSSTKLWNCVCLYSASTSKCASFSPYSLETSKQSGKLSEAVVSALTSLE